MLREAGAGRAYLSVLAGAGWDSADQLQASASRGAPLLPPAVLQPRTAPVGRVRYSRDMQPKKRGVVLCWEVSSHLQPLQKEDGKIL